MSLAEQNMKLARMIAFRVWNRIGYRADLDDLTQDAMVGLVKAEQSYRQDSGVKFTTYAHYRISGEIHDGLRRMMDASRHQARGARDLEQIECALTQRIGRMPESDEIAAEAGMSLEEYHIARQQSRCETVSLDMKSEDSDCSMLEELSDGVEEAQLMEVYMGEIERAMLDLPEREQAILKMIYFEQKNQAEVANELSLSAGRISQLFRSGMSRLRHVLNIPQPLTPAY